MTLIERQVTKAQRRLWLNRWLQQWGWCLLVVAAIWLAAWLANRLFLPGRVPKAWMAGVAAGVSILVSAIWMWLTREPKLVAATALDEAAGLRERVSSGLCVQPQSSDPFAQAVVADAEHVVAGLSPRKFIPLRWSRSLSLSAVLLVAALLSLLLPEFDLLNRGGQADARERAAQLKRAEAIVAQPVSIMKEIEDKHPEIKADQGDRKFDDPLQKQRELDADVVRREAFKKLDKMEDALKQKAAEDKFKALDETKERLKQLEKPDDPKTELGKLTEALANGDFEEAQKAIKKAQEELAKRAKDGKLDPQKAEEMRKQLNDLAQKCQKAAQDKQSERELQNAGMSKADAQRMLEALAKKDPQQLEKLAKEMAEKLKQQGMTEQQIKDMMKKIQQRQQACQNCQGLGQKMSNAAKNMEAGNTESASQELGEAGQMLDEMEQLEQTMNDLEADMSKLDEARNQMNEQEKEGECSACKGSGFRKDGSPCPACKGKGKGRGVGMGPGQGDGTRPRDDSVKTNTTNSKAASKFDKNGRIIGQDFVKGQMLTGKAEAEFVDKASAAEIDATDNLENERIPRLYRRGVKTYFDRLNQTFKDGKGKAPSGQGAKDQGAKDEGAKGDAAKGEGEKGGDSKDGAGSGGSSKDDGKSNQGKG